MFVPGTAPFGGCAWHVLPIDAHAVPQFRDRDRRGNRRERSDRRLERRARAEGIAQTSFPRQRPHRSPRRTSPLPDIVNPTSGWVSTRRAVSERMLAAVMDTVRPAVVFREMHDVVVRSGIQDVVLAIDLADDHAVLVDAGLFGRDALEGDAGHVVLPVRCRRRQGRLPPSPRRSSAPRFTLSSGHRAQPCWSGGRARAARRDLRRRRRRGRR